MKKPRLGVIDLHALDAEQKRLEKECKKLKENSVDYILTTGRIAQIMIIKEKYITPLVNQYSNIDQIIEEHTPIKKYYTKNITNEENKLFLCSHDFGIGDKVFDNYPTDDGSMVIENEDELNLAKISSTSCKLIGLVSTKAMEFVKEGMEFIAEGNDCEVFPIHRHGENEEIIYLDESGNVTNVPVYLIKHEGIFI